LQDAAGSAVDLVRLVVQRFPSFRDQAVYDGQRGPTRAELDPV
jgi:hypothetical protein